MKYKILLINCVRKGSDEQYALYDTKVPPINLGIIAALTPEHKWEIKILDEYVDDFVFENVDLVCLTAFTSSINRAYEIAKIFKKNHIHCIIGGNHISFNQDEALNYCDTIVVGEVEKIWGQILDDFENASLKRIYVGDLASADEIPVPRHDLFSDKYSVSAIQTTRGCPMSCSFCSVHQFNGKKFRRRHIASIIEELKLIKNELIFFVDDNLVGYSQKDFNWAKSLFRSIIESGIKKRWICMVSLNFADDKELMELASESGCYMVMIGIESENISSLQEFNKYINIKRLNLRDLVRKIHMAKILVRGLYIFGAETDNIDILRLSCKNIISNNVDIMQVTILTPLCGTSLFKKMHLEGKIVYNNFPEDWDKYDEEHLVFEHEYLTKKSLEDAQKDIYRKFYSNKTIFKKFLKTLLETKSLKISRIALFLNLRFRSLFYKKTIIDRLLNRMFFKNGGPLT